MMKSKFSLGMLLLGQILVVSPLHTAPPDATYERYLSTKGPINKALLLLRERKLNDAKSVFEKCAKEVRGHYEAHFYLAQLAYENKDYGGALGHIRTAIHSLEELDQAYHEKSTENRKRMAERMQEFQHTVDLITQISGGGSGGCKSGTLIEANQSIRDLEQATSSPLATDQPFAIPAVFHFVNGNCLLRLKRNAEARDAYASAIQSDPNHADSWNNLTYLWLVEKDPMTALKTLRGAEAKGVTIHPGLKEAVLLAAKQSDAK